MRFYPFGSGSLDITLIPTASVSDYASQAQSTLRVVSASVAVNGLPGLPGLNGSCSFQAGATGPAGPQGPSGDDGTIFYAT
jgi:hypothetical protein